MLITVEPLGAEFLRITFSRELFLLWIVGKKKRRRKEKKERKKEREKASKLSKNRTGDNCMSFGTDRERADTWLSSRPIAEL